ncbi:hypothetical protein JCM8097_003247 [Rhodosporidiobolus ruineniae]
MTTTTPSSTPASSRPGPASGVLRKVDDFFSQNAGARSKTFALFSACSEEDVYGCIGLVFICATFGTWLVWLVKRDEPFLWLAWTLVVVRTVNSFVQHCVDSVVHLFVLIPLKAVAHIGVSLVVAPLVGLVLGAPYILFIAYPFFLWSNGTLSLVILFNLDLSEPVESFLDYALLPLSIQYFCTDAAFFAPYITFAYLFNAYVVLTSLFDLSPLRSLLSFCAALEDQHLNRPVEMEYQGVRKQEDDKVAKLEREVEELKKALRVQGKTE